MGMQSSINQALSLGAAATLGAKKVAADTAIAEAAKTEEAIKLTEAVPATAKEVNKLSEEVEELANTQAYLDVAAKKEIKEAKDYYDANVSNPYVDTSGAEDIIRQRYADIEKRALALNALEGKLKAKQIQKDYFDNRLKKITGGKR